MPNNEIDFFEMYFKRNTIKLHFFFNYNSMIKIIIDYYKLFLQLRL